MALKVAKRGAVAPFIVMDVMKAAAEREAQGAHVLHLEVGQPSTGAPSAVRRKVESLMNGTDPMGYTVALGIEPLRRRIAENYKDEYGIDVDPDRIAVTCGSSAAFLLTFLSAFDHGDRVGICAPGYPAYRNILHAVGLETVDISVGPDTHFQPTPELLDTIPGPLDGLMVASPSNPTGSMLSPAALGRLYEYCADRGVRLISDEIYHGLTFGEEAQTALAFGDDAIVINSFSKYYSMTGWRLGWMVVPPSLVRSVECLAQNMFISAPTLSQHACVDVFDCKDELNLNVARYARNRELLLDELPKAGFDQLAPADGAFYLYADVAHMTNDSEEFCRRILNETGVAVTPGVDFDPLRGAQTLRFSFAGSTRDMAEAARRLIAWRTA